MSSSLALYLNDESILLLLVVNKHLLIKPSSFLYAIPSICSSSFSLSRRKHSSWKHVLYQHVATSISSLFLPTCTHTLDFKISRCTSLSLSPECSRWMNLNGHSMEDCEEEVVVISKHGIVSNPISIEWQSQAYLKVQSSVTRKCQNPLWFPIRHRSKQIGLVPLERSMKRCSSV